MAIVSISGGCTKKNINVGFQFKLASDNYCYLGGSYLINPGTSGGRERELNVKGFVYGQNFGGCRACGNKYIYQCHECGAFNCYDGKAADNVACPACGASGNVPETTNTNAGAPIVRSRAVSEVILAIDVSASMDEKVSGGRTRLDEVKEAAVNNFIRALNGVKIAVVTFGDTAKTELDFTSDMNAAERTVRALSTRGKTTSPLAHIRREFPDFDKEMPGTSRFIVVFTDGAWNGTGHENTAQKLRDGGVCIITIGCAGADRSFLTRIATQGANIDAIGDDFDNPFATAAKLVTQ